jgi:hypothetical protein
MGVDEFLKRRSQTVKHVLALRFCRPPANHFHRESVIAILRTCVQYSFLRSLAESQLAPATHHR